MAYVIYGENCPIVFLANPRTGSTSIRNAIIQYGAEQQGQHHDPPTDIPKGAKVIQTIRHHCDVLVSFWYKAQRGNTLEQFIFKVIDGKYRWLRSEGFYNHWPVHIDVNMNYETLSSDWSKVCDMAGLPNIQLIPTYSKRPKKIHWSLLFTPELYNRVYDHYKEEMEKYNYGRN
jgi:hypothetical protein